MRKHSIAIIFSLALFVTVWFVPVVPTVKSIGGPGGLPCGLKNDPIWNYIPCPTWRESHKIVFKSGMELYEKHLIRKENPGMWWL